MSVQNAMDTIKDKMRSGELTVAEANVEMIRAEGARLIRGKMPRATRTALNNGVKEGKLEHYKKDGHKPECYFKAGSEFYAKELRYKAQCEALQSLKAFSEAGRA